MPELVFFRRGEEVLRVGMGRERMVLGRGEKSDVVIPDPEVSRKQVALVFDGEQCTLEDLSGKGTQVAGASMSKGVLADGSDIALGQWRAIFRLHGSGQAEGPTEVGAHTEVQPRESGSRWQPAQVRIRQGANETVHKLGGDKESFTVGKDPSCDLIVQDPFISGRHLKVSRRDGHFHVVDTNSTNGTWMGSVRIYEVLVGLPTTLRLGETDFVLEPVSANRKELVARALHECSQRAEKPFIPVNCAAISKELIESELFGHEKGSFTGATNARKGAFEEADGGTLFLDEIGELPLDLQAKLLRALENGEIKRVGASRPAHVDVRVVAATNRDLLSAVREGRFREDLYYRLCVVPMHLPPLRSRKSDILGLAEHFLRMYSPRGQTVRLSPAAVERLQQHSWPGNIRELRNVVHRALLLRKGANIEPTDLSFDQEVNRDTGVTVPDLPPGMTLEQMLLKLERQIVEAALRRYNNNRERVARELGVARSTLFKRLKEWGLTRQEEDPE